MFQLETDNLPPGTYTVNITITVTTVTTGATSSTTIHVKDANGNALIPSATATQNNPYNPPPKTVDVTVTPDSSGKAIVAISDPSVQSNNGGNAWSQVSITVNSVKKN
jgi:hypothetical protein